MKVTKKGLGQPSPAEEPEGPGGGGDSRAGAAGGLLPPNRVGQEELVPTVMATPHPGERGCGAALHIGTPEPPHGVFWGQHSSVLDHRSLPPPSALLADQLGIEWGHKDPVGKRRDIPEHLRRG